MILKGWNLGELALSGHWLGRRGTGTWGASQTCGFRGAAALPFVC